MRKQKKSITAPVSSGTGVNIATGIQQKKEQSTLLQKRLLQLHRCTDKICVVTGVRLKEVLVKKENR